MATRLDQAWKIKLERCRTALERNHFEAFVVDDPSAARALVIDALLPRLAVRSVSWGDSMTLYATGLLDYFRRDARFEVIETFDPRLSRAELIPRRRQALLADLFLTGTNAITETGTLVNLDMVGNRVAGLTFGPRHVILTVGRNKIVADLPEAVRRIKRLAAPVNAMRHAIKTPCVKSAACMDCQSPDRICNTWAIHERSYPQGRIKIVLINTNAGL